MRALLLALSLLTCGASSAGRSDRSATLIPLLPGAGRQVAIAGGIDGQRGLFLFDSGWGLSAVTPAMSRRIGCSPWGQLTGFRAIGERADYQQCQPVTVMANDRALLLPTVMLVDMNKFMPPGSPDYVGALGLDAFAGKAITIRSEARQIVLENAASLTARTLRATPIPIRLMRGTSGASLTAFIGVPTKSGMLWMLLDTGNNGGTMIGRHAADLLGLDPTKSHGQQLTMPITSGIVLREPVQVLDLIMDGNIGSDFLDRWDLTLDLRQGRGWLTRATPYKEG